MCARGAAAGRPRRLAMRVRSPVWIRSSMRVRPSHLVHPDAAADIEAAAIEANAQEVEPLSHAQNDDIPEDATGARFTTAAADLHAVSQWLAQSDWTVVTSELGYVAKNFPELSEDDRTQVGEFLQTLEDHDDVHRVWAAVR